MSAKIKKSKSQRKFKGGALRDSNKGKVRYDLISPHMLRRLAEHMRKGADHYGERNFEKGMNFSVLFESAYRHLIAYQCGDKEEDNLAAILFNIGTIIHFEEMNRAEELDDMCYQTPVKHNQKPKKE